MGNQNPLVIAVDTGNRCIKTVSQIMVAGLHETDQKPALVENVLTYKDHYFSLSNDRCFYRRNKTLDDTYFILTLFGIVAELDVRGIPYDAESPAPDVILAVGLPPAHMQRQREDFKKYFLRGPISFGYKGKNCHIEINDVHVLPQAFSASYLHYGELRQYDYAYIVDIGGYTTDVIGLEHGSVNPAACFSEDAGMIHLYNLIRTEINTRYDSTPKEQQIDSLLADPTYELEDGMKSLAHEMANAYINDLLRKLAEQGIDLRLCKGVFVGGGVTRLLSQIKASPLVKNPIVISEIRANARGYEAIVLNKLSRKAR